MASRTITTTVGRVVESGNCSGCGACAQIFSGIDFRLNEAGFVRPHVLTDRSLSRTAVDQFNQVCPGVALSAPPKSHKSHWLFGRYEAAWEAHAADATIRSAGSSGGVITALAAWLSDDEAERIIAVASESSSPARTVPVRITSRQEALASSGSRYAPVAAISSPYFGSATTVIAKPCEVAAASRLRAQRAEPAPLLISFFCAGTPSQHATDRLVDLLGIEPPLTSLRYRGNGWPGEFEVRGAHSQTGSLSYDESWGKHLGRAIQDRCKICPDGTGEASDITVGDYWRADERGFPIFTDAPGSSVLIARTERGLAVLERALQAGVIEVSPIDLDSVAQIQPLQRQRRETVAARVLGRRLAGRPSPRFAGYGHLWLSIRSPYRSLRAGLGTWLRARRPVATPDHLPSGQDLLGA